MRNQIELTLLGPSKILGYPMIPDFGKNTALQKVPTLHICVFLAREACTWKWVWNIRKWDW